MTNKYLNSLREEDNVTLTENLAKTNKSTLNDLLDFYGSCGALRTRSEQEITSLFSKAFGEDKLYAMKCLFYCRDIRGGQGERRTPKIIYNWLATHHSEYLLKNLEHIPFYGRWDDIFVLRNTPLEDKMVSLIKTQLSEDLDSDHPSLLGKWMPSENASSDKTKELALWFIKKLEITPRSYRKLLSKLRSKIRIVEKQMCANQWDNINYERVPSKASMLYRKAFSRHSPDRYVEYLNSVEKGEAKINTKAIFPYELMRNIIDFNGWDCSPKPYNKTIAMQWDNLPDYIEDGEQSIVVCDTSGSMRGLPINVSVSLSIYFAERNKGPWQNHFITFSVQPELQRIIGSNVFEKAGNLANANWDGNTNIQAVFDLLINTAVKHQVDPEDMLDTVYIISDMEFDQATYGSQNKTNFEVIRSKYEQAGYKMPKLVFWNVDSRNDQHPITINDQGVFLVSGCSPSIFKHVIESKTMNAVDLMKEVLNNERYQKVVV